MNRFRGIVQKKVLPPKTNYTVRNYEFFAFTPIEVTSTVVAVDYPGAANKVADIGRVSPVTEIKGFKSVGTRAIVRYVKGRGSPIGANNIDEVKKWGMRIDFRNPESTAYVAIEPNGKLMITSSGPYERVLRFLTKYYFPGIFFNKVTIIKIDGRTHVDTSINLDELGREIVTKVPRGAYGWFNERELYAGARLTWKNPKMSLILFANGTILFQGLKSMDVVKQVHKVFTELFTKYGVDMRATMHLRARHIRPVPARKNLSAKRKRAAGRYEMAFGYDNTKEGFYVRPGANKSPRFYPVPSPSKLPLVRQKVLRAYTNAGVNIPNSVKQLFGFNASVQLKEKAEIRRAKNWSDAKEGFYVRPGPGDQPYFYKIPKGVAAGRKTVIAAYQKANRRIPTPVREIFKIPASPELEHLPKNHALNRNAKGVLRLNGKQIDRYTTDQLVQVARNLGIAEVNSKMKVAQIANAIKKKLGSPPSLSPGDANLVLNGVPISFLMNGRVMRGGRARQWATLKAAEQNAIAKEYLVNTNYTNWKTLPKKHQYTAILALKSAYNKPITPPSPSPRTPTPSPPTPPAPKTPSPSPKSKKVAELKKKIENSFGNKYKHLVKNYDAMNLYTKLTALPLGKRGAPLQADVNKTTTTFLKNLKRSRQYAQLSQNYRNAIVINDQLRNYLGSNANVNRYKNQLTAIAVAPNAKGKLPKKSDVKAAIKAWIGYSYPPGPAGIPRVVENMVTGETRVVMPPNRSKVPSPQLRTPPAKRLSPLKVAKREPAYKRPRKPKNLGPAVGPVKPPPPGGNSMSRNNSVNLNKLMR